MHLHASHHVSVQGQNAKRLLQIHLGANDLHHRRRHSLTHHIFDHLERTHSDAHEGVGVLARNPRVCFDFIICKFTLESRVAVVDVEDDEHEQKEVRGLTSGL